MAETGGRRQLAPSGGQIGDGMVAGATQIMKDAGKTMLRDAPRATRFVARRIPGAPGLLLDAVEVGAARDKARAGWELAGGGAGGLIGGALGGPLGAAIGSTVGEKGVELVYDHQDDIKAWMKRRIQGLERGAAEQIRPLMPPPMREMI